jgi:hypothetical protein
MNYGETVRTIYEQRSRTTADAPSGGAARARRLCAGLVVAGALFGSAAPAHADDGLAVGGLDGASIEATVAAVQAAAVTQASAIVNEATQAQAPVSQAAPASPQSTPQSGSGSGVGSGINAPVPSPAQTGAQPAAAASSASPAPQPDADPQVVAPASAVVSQPDDAGGSSPAQAQTTAVPSAAFHKLAREYQQNPARYHSLNSLPISRETVPASAVKSIVNRAPFTEHTPAGKATPNPSSNCSQTSCDAPDPEPAHAHVGAAANGPAANGAVASPTAATQQDSAGALGDRLGRPSVSAGDAEPLAPRATTTKSSPSRPVTPAKARQSVKTHSVKAPGRPGSASARAGHAQARQHLDRPHGLRAPVRTEVAQRASARATAPAESVWPWLGLVLLLFGITSIGLAAVSVGAGGAGAVGGMVARVRTTAISTAAIGTRLRSKGLSARAHETSRDRPATRGIRYRD